MNDNFTKRILVHPISVVILSLISTIFAIITFEYVTATNEMRQNATWFYVNSNLIVVPFLTVILTLVINLIIVSIKESIEQENKMLYLKLKQAIDESAEKQRIAQESILEKQTVAIDKQTIALDKERDAREKGIERLNSILNRMEEKYFSKPPNSGNN